MNAVLALFRILIWVVCLRFAHGLFRGSRGPSQAFMMAWLMGALSAFVFAALGLVGVLWCIPIAAALLALLMPWTIARRVLIPLGASRAARFMSELSGWAWGRDRHGGGLVAGAWALLRQKEPSSTAIVALEQSRGNAERLGATQVLATGLIAAARGDREAARQLIASVGEIGVKTSPKLAHKLAREWLVADAAESGSWERVADLAGKPGPRTRMTRLLGAVGSRLSQRQKAPGTPLLWLHWAVAPSRRNTLQLVRAAARVAPAGGSGKNQPRLRLDTSIRPEPYADALDSHVAVLTKREHRGLVAVDLASLARVWDRALGAPGTRAMIMQRAAILGARSGERALSDLCQAVATDLADLARSAELAIADWRPDKTCSTVLADAQRQLENELMASIELAFDVLFERTSAKRQLSSIDEWREWLSHRAMYQRAASLGGIEMRRLAFHHVHHTVCKLAVWLWNERKEHLMANAMFRWLLTEAMAVGDTEAIELQSRNWDQEL